MKTLPLPLAMRLAILSAAFALGFVDLTHAAESSDPPRLHLTGEVDKSLSLTLADIRALPRTQLLVQEPHTGESVTYEGVPLHELLKKAGIPHGEALRGEFMSLAVLITAADEYQAVFSLAELDPAFRAKTVLLADRIDGKDLDANRGPFRLIIPEEKRPSRWVRQIVRIELVRVGKTDGR